MNVVKLTKILIKVIWIILIPTTILILSYYPSIGRPERWIITFVIAMIYAFIFRKTLKMKWW